MQIRLLAEANKIIILLIREFYKEKNLSDYWTCYIPLVSF